MVAQRLFIVTLLIGQHLQRQAAGFIREQRQLQVVDRTGRQGMGNRLYAIDIQLIIKNFNIKHRAKQRFVARRLATVADNLFGVIALMAAHFLQLSGKTRGQLRQRFPGVNGDRQRQNVEHRTGGGERRGAHTTHKNKACGILRSAAQPSQPQGGQRQSQVRALALRRACRQPAKDAGIHLQLHAPDIAAGRPSRQRRIRQRGRRRQRLTLRLPERFVALPGIAAVIALVLFHHLGKGRKRRGGRLFAALPGAINRGDLAGNGREAEAIDQQMVVTLIPVPAVIAYPQQLMADQRITAVHPQILPEVGLHPRQRGGVRVARRAQILIVRFGKNAAFINPLPGFAAIFTKAHAEGVGLREPGDNRPPEQDWVNIAAQLNIVGDAPCAGQRREALRHPDPRLRRNQR